MIDFTQQNSLNFTLRNILTIELKIKFTDGEKLVAQYISDKRLISRLYGKLSKLNSLKQNNRVMEIKIKINKWDLNKPKSFCTTKDTICNV